MPVCCIPPAMSLCSLAYEISLSIGTIMDGAQWGQTGFRPPLDQTKIPKYCSLFSPQSPIARQTNNESRIAEQSASIADSTSASPPLCHGAAPRRRRQPPAPSRADTGTSSSLRPAVLQGAGCRLQRNSGGRWLDALSARL
jgi:hypothetical protein